MILIIVGGVEYANDLYLMMQISMEAERRVVTVTKKLMRTNFLHGWPNSDAIILQFESCEGALINPKQLITQYSEQDWDDNAIWKMLSWWLISVYLHLDLFDVFLCLNFCPCSCIFVCRIRVRFERFMLSQVRWNTTMGILWHM